MDITLHPPAILAMWLAMMALALVPDASSMLVATRSLASNWTHGIAVAIGIIIGDLLFILIAVYGLTLLAEYMTPLFEVIRFAAALYLIAFGLTLWRAPLNTADGSNIQTGSWRSDAVCGLLVTLGDAKAIVFYLGFLPAFMDLSAVNVVDVGVIIVLAASALGLVKTVYALLGDRARLLSDRPLFRRRIYQIAGSVMILIGLYAAVNGLLSIF